MLNKAPERNHVTFVSGVLSIDSNQTSFYLKKASLFIFIFIASYNNIYYAKLTCYGVFCLTYGFNC